MGPRKAIGTPRIGVDEIGQDICTSGTFISSGDFELGFGRGFFGSVVRGGLKISSENLSGGSSSQ